VPSKSVAPKAGAGMPATPAAGGGMAPRPAPSPAAPPMQDFARSPTFDEWPKEMGPRPTSGGRTRK